MSSQRLRAHLNFNHRGGTRFALAATAAILLAVFVAVVGWTPPASGDEEPRVRAFTLTASEFDWDIQPGTTVRAWGYNQQVPGP
ncbi:MAG: hypothetical protein ACRDJH_19845, partial [Thermomicrobiales bacterium]